MGFLLTILALVLAILALPWLKRPVEAFARRIRERVLVGRALRNTLPAVRSIRKGFRSRATNDFMVCEWNHQVNVDGNGNTNTLIECLLVNITDGELDTIAFPVYFDSADTELRAWAKTGRSPLHLDVSQWDSDKGNGLVEVSFPSPLKPRDSFRLKWGYFNQGSFSDGDEWWEWFIGRPHGMFKLALRFDEGWSVRALSGCIVPEEHVPVPPRLRRNKILWTVAAPVPGRKYRIDFILARASGLDEIGSP